MPDVKPSSPVACNTAELFKHKTVYSFEVYPAKKTAPIKVVYDAVAALQELRPDYISVTYGAGGGAVTSAATVEIASLVQNTYGIPAVAHLPGINLTHDDVRSLLGRLAAHNIENVLALRGDLLPGTVQQGEFAHASDVAAFIREVAQTPFNIIGACYPETHTEATSPEDDLRNLKLKVEAGVNQLTTQLFFDNSHFYTFIERARALGITVPIQAGIMPVINGRQAERMVKLCGANLPTEFGALIERYGADDDAMREAGIDYAVCQIADLLEHGVDGIHLYTMNNPATAAAITEAVRPLL